MLRVNIETYEEPYETLQRKIMCFQGIPTIIYQKEETNLVATLVLFKLHLA